MLAVTVSSQVDHRRRCIPRISEIDSNADSSEYSSVLHREANRSSSAPHPTDCSYVRMKLRSELHSWISLLTPGSLTTISREATTQPHRDGQTSEICQSIGNSPASIKESLTFEKQREPKNFLADSGDGCAAAMTTWRGLVIRAVFF